MKLLALVLFLVACQKSYRDPKAELARMGWQAQDCREVETGKFFCWTPDNRGWECAFNGASDAVCKRMGL